MQIYTSYFANLQKLPNNLVPISICGKAPDWYKGLQCKLLAPKYDFFKVWQQTHDNDYYIDCFYKQVLNKLDATEVYNMLAKLSNNQDVVLICYEKPSNFCHRHLVAQWLSDELHINCQEYGI